MESRTREHLIDSKSSVQDITNYLENSSDDLTSGVRVDSAPFSGEGPYATVMCSTTAKKA